MIRLGGDRDLTELRTVLERENAALDRGDASGALSMLPAKQALLERLESRAEDLAARLADNETLRQNLGHIQDLLTRNAARVARLRDAAGQMAADIERLRNRHGLGGLYGADGGARTPSVAQRPRVDREV